MRKISLFLLALTFVTSVKAQIFKAKDGGTEVTFFSSSPLEDITATNKGAIVVLNTTSGDIQVRISIANFKFKNAMMEEHFNENYMETEKKVGDAYPNRNAVFKGKINEKVDYTKEGETKVTVTGKMEMHGVTKDVTLEGTITKKGTEMIVFTKFKIKVADYNIKVPSLYVKNIAEVVDVTLSSTLEPFVKK
jgi:hypothetical protein